MAVLFIALTVAGLFVVRRRSSETPPYRTPFYPVTPVLFLILAAVLLVLLFGNSPVQALLGVGVTVLGIPVYFLVFRKQSTQQRPSGEAHGMD